MLNANFTLTSTNVDGNSATVHLEPLEKGFGHTLGNALRRVLLTHLSGSAATKVQISGINHQFSTLDGLQENIIDFILNLKGVNFRIEGDDDAATVKLNVTGKKQVTAKDLDLPAGVSISNPDHPLATLTDAKSKLKAVITVENGVGYEAAKLHQTDEVGVIPLDSVFTPVLKVSYEVEATRVGRHTDLDKIIIDVETNGTITPEEAIKESASILANYFTQIFDPTFKEEVKEEVSSILGVDNSVEELELPTRVTNALKKGGYNSLQDFDDSSMDDLVKVKNLGEKSVKEIIKRLSQKGIEVK